MRYFYLTTFLFLGRFCLTFIKYILLYIYVINYYEALNVCVTLRRSYTKRIVNTLFSTAVDYINRHTSVTVFVYTLMRQNFKCVDISAKRLRESRISRETYLSSNMKIHIYLCIITIILLIVINYCKNLNKSKKCEQI